MLYLHSDCSLSLSDFPLPSMCLNSIEYLNSEEAAFPDTLISQLPQDFRVVFPWELIIQACVIITCMRWSGSSLREVILN